MLSQTCCPMTIQGYLSSLHAVHRIMEWPWVGDAISIQQAIRKLYRIRGSAPRQAFGITHEMRDAMIAAADADNLEGTMHRALIRTGYETLFRGSELRGLQVHDVSRGHRAGMTSIWVSQRRIRCGRGFGRWCLTLVPNCSMLGLKERALRADSYFGDAIGIRYPTSR